MLGRVVAPPAAAARPIECAGGCGRWLRDPVSIARKMGPRCWEKANPEGRGHSPTRINVRLPRIVRADGQLDLFEELRSTTMSKVRFGLVVDDDNGHHVHFRLFAATGGQHFGGCGKLTMTVREFTTFRGLLEPMLTDTAEPLASGGVVPAGTPTLVGEQDGCIVPAIRPAAPESEPTDNPHLILETRETSSIGTWIYRVKITDRQAIIGAYYHGQIGIQFYTGPGVKLWIGPGTAEQIFEHLAPEKGDDRITRQDCIEAIRLIQAAIIRDRDKTPPPA